MAVSAGCCRDQPLCQVLLHKQDLQQVGPMLLVL